MENAFSYVTEAQPRMQGGDSRYNRLAQVQMFREANPDLELEAKTKKVTEKLSESMNVIANEPSLAFFRIQEHVRKCLPQLAETKHEVQDLQQKVQGASFDAEYAANAVHEMHKSSSHFTSIQDLLKNSMFLKQQIDYEQNRSSKGDSKPQVSAKTGQPKKESEMDSVVH
ncbi:BLOC-1-related complex subunit 8-like [Mercenaria mercenaria]|uniref:BLOC-1-related complex subunit 8-like n=1 Tax=Mercenaria mercenaria TaxID=6596 RepID=UPI00234F82AE|nr:BLOC-1-related complex subunit 8-like [Mercenaria mercenaria]